MRKIILISIFYLLNLTASGQPGELILKNDLLIKGKNLVISVTMKNTGEKSLFINTSNFYVISTICDSLCAGLGVALKSQSGKLILYDYPTTFIQGKDAEKEVKRSIRINKRQQPKIKINPKKNLIIDKESPKVLNLKIPLKHWTLSKGETYTVCLYYKKIEGVKEKKESIQMNQLTTEIGSFTY